MTAVWLIMVDDSENDLERDLFIPLIEPAEGDRPASPHETIVSGGVRYGSPPRQMHVRGFLVAEEVHPDGRIRNGYPGALVHDPKFVDDAEALFDAILQEFDGPRRPGDAATTDELVVVLLWDRRLHTTFWDGIERKATEPALRAFLRKIEGRRIEVVKPSHRSLKRPSRVCYPFLMSAGTLPKGDRPGDAGRAAGDGFDCLGKQEMWTTLAALFRDLSLPVAARPMTWAVQSKIGRDALSELGRCDEAGIAGLKQSLGTASFERLSEFREECLAGTSFDVLTGGRISETALPRPGSAASTPWAVYIDHRADESVEIFSLLDLPPLPVRALDEGRRRIADALKRRDWQLRFGWKKCEGMTANDVATLATLASKGVESVKHLELVDPDPLAQERARKNKWKWTTRIKSLRQKIPPGVVETVQGSCRTHFLCRSDHMIVKGM